MYLRRVRLGEVTDNYDSLRRPVKGTERVAGEFPYYGASGIVDYVDNFIFNGDYLLIAEDGENLRSRSTPIAFMATGKFWVNNHAHVVKGNHLSDTRFLSYILAITDVSGYLTGSTQPKLTRAAMDSIQLMIPELHEQKAIVEVLGALDDKIAANTKLASTADQWVRAEYDLINRQSSEERIIGDLVSHRRQAIDPVSLETPTPYVGLEHIPRRLMWLDNHGSSEEVTSNKSYFHTGDILFGKLRPYFHKVVTAPTSGICSTDILVLASKEEIFSGYVLASLTHDDVIQAVTALSAGTRMPRTNWKDLSQVTIPWPGDLVATAFSESIQDIRGYVVGLMAENQTLAATRDALLPQLMSGKLRVKEAEKVLESAL
ncbi:restriction endonuclease subunit S [Corynebacterium guangdongense]|uniref:Type I restriction enzyme S subunit n=1 Tax=Corynebacterium guangdongense TaxID=1783348 RepID=A0ABU1ZUX7_9CORY|nr:restriction endonuclease subunit S [Corynebacterium guangdongense]MDR7328733.1 type I restriction enzyme S subunit [Corynebacterium guangdongense]WJZ17310.1 Type I restriction modification DNA specificity domain protein [Corynebacterium guangdongense]